MSEINKELDRYVAALREKKKKVSKTGTVIMLSLGLLGSWFSFNFFKGGHFWFGMISGLLAAFVFVIVITVYKI